MVATKPLTTYRPDQEPELLTASDTFDGGEVLPGFRMAVADVFR